MWCEYKTWTFSNCQIRQRKNKTWKRCPQIFPSFGRLSNQELLSSWWLLLVECVQLASLCGCQWARELQACVEGMMGCRCLWDNTTCTTRPHTQTSFTRQSSRRRAAGYETQSRDMSWGGVLSWTLTAPVLSSYLPVCCPWTNLRLKVSTFINPTPLLANVGA